MLFHKILLTSAALMLIPPAWAADVLSVVPGQGVVSIGEGIGRVDTGPTDPAVTPHVERVFVVKNPTSRPVTIGRLRASCGCETLLLRKGGKPIATTVLGPGEQAEVQMTVTIVDQRPGLVQKYAWVEDGRSHTPLATLEMDITVRPSYAFTPIRVSFPAAALGESVSQPLTVTVDRDVLTGGLLPPLVSTDPQFRVAAQGNPQPDVRDGRPSVTQHYQITLVAGLSGRVTGNLRFRLPSDTQSPLRAATVSLGAEVAGHLTATPKVVFLGSISAGHSITRQVLLSDAALEAGREPTVVSSSPWLMTTLGTPDVRAGGVEQRLLKITLKAGAPAGALQAQVTVVSGTGERLLISVLGDVVP